MDSFLTTRSPISHYVPFFDTADNFGVRPVQIALESLNIFVILYLLIVNKVKVPPQLVEHLSRHPCLLDVERVAVFMIVEEMDFFGPAVKQWVQSSNFMNIFV